MNPRNALTITAAMAALGMPSVGGNVEVIHRREGSTPSLWEPKSRRHTGHASHWRGHSQHAKRAAEKQTNRERMRKESQRRNRKQKR